ncbi:NAD(P)H-dependent oxidoreductase [Rhodococcus sp. (in: high G+C Gram-positive bacteria)]|uniref:NADPH-dependent FMN reductase n=1 Tax=Rhodococcus sp. TaxID=1831 RepID=UPI00257C00C2|nr:NAD(P)H-dependent oxidoreductase [Rhodococcus sp. (in: high G+C Gram-positive bacteria)]MBQ7804443.1 NAD(P)H-dependent oxidoreductase [Rhodococcus sp. (in: high G+C Gram-positive bacteria)]
MKLTVVVGNPKPNSRTLDAASTLGRALTGSDPDVVVDVITLGSGLLGWGDRAVKAAVESVSSSDLVVVASPTFKATYAGVLKLFLDQFAGSEGLRDVVVVPVMLGAGPSHAMAPDVFLKPVLVELGATVPAPGLYLIDSTYSTDSLIGDYAERWGEILLSAATTGTEPR